MEITEELIRQLVIEVVDKLELMKASAQAAAPSATNESFSGKVLSAWDVETCFRRGCDRLQVSRKTILTPLARERAHDLGVSLDVV